MARTIVLVAAALLAAPALAPHAVSWGNDAIQEPSSKYDLPKYMWQTPNDRTQIVNGQMPDRIYFNAQLSHAFLLRHTNAPEGRLEPVVLHADALLGYWRDCNNDGYIGSKYLGMKDYLVAEAAATPHPVDTAVCPVGTEFHNATGVGNPGFTHPHVVYGKLGPVIHEFMDVGPARQYYRPVVTWQVNDPDARVWGDLGRPEEPRVLAQSFRDAAAEQPPVLIFERGTFDSWNGHIRYLDVLTFGRLSNVYAVATGQNLYDTPLAGNDPPTPLHAVRYRAYSAGHENNEWKGRPMVRVWGCDAGEEEPRLSPGLDPDGAVVDSANHTFMGVRHHAVVPNPFGGDLVNARLTIGPGCDGPRGRPATFNDGLFLPHPEDPTLAMGDARKATVDMFFQYRDPHDQASDLLTAMWGLVPRLDRTFSATWYGHQLFVKDGPVDRGADYYTFYAKIGAAAYRPRTFHPSQSADVVPGAVLDPFTNRYVPPQYRYGEEACSAAPHHNGWDCSAWPQPSPAWDVHFNPEWGVKLGETYQLRDTDCTDLTVAAPAETKAAKDLANAGWGLVVPLLLDPPYEPVGGEAFHRVCE